MMRDERHEGGPATATRKNGLTHLKPRCIHMHTGKSEASR